MGGNPISVWLDDPRVPTDFAGGQSLVKCGDAGGGDLGVQDENLTQGFGLREFQQAGVGELCIVQMEIAEGG